MQSLKDAALGLIAKKAGAPILLAAGGAFLLANYMSERERKKAGKTLLYAGLAGLYPLVQNVLKTYRSRISHVKDEIKEDTR